MKLYRFFYKISCSLVTTDTDASVTSKRAAADYASTFDGDDTNLDEEVGVFFILIFKIYFFQT